jgi:hypothetical protein
LAWITLIHRSKRVDYADYGPWIGRIGDPSDPNVDPRPFFPIQALDYGGLRQSKPWISAAEAAFQADFIADCRRRAALSLRIVARRRVLPSFAAFCRVLPRSGREFWVCESKD